MVTFPSLLGFVLALPAAALRTPSEAARRRRAIQSLSLSPHVLRDIGIEELQNPADDPRWALKPHLER